MADMPRKVKDVIVMILAYNGVELKYLETRKRRATIDVAVRFTYTDAKKRRRRINASKAVVVDLTKMAREASKLMSYDAGSEKLDYIQYVGKVLHKFISDTKMAERVFLSLRYDQGHPIPVTKLTKGTTENGKVH